jgi:hypothetical protein
MKEELEIGHTERGGIGWFFFALIPGALAGALLMYFAFYTGVVDWQKAQRIEGRMDGRVGVNGELKKPVDLINRDSSCLKISRSFLDSGTVTAYVTSHCNYNIRYWEIHWESVAPDGTIIHSDYTNNGFGEPSPGETVETTYAVQDDPRTAKIIVWTSSPTPAN